VDTRIEHGQKSVFLIKIFVERIMVDSMIFNDITHLTRRVSFSVFVGTIHCGRVKRHTTKRRRRSNQNYLARKMFQGIYLGF